MPPRRLLQRLPATQNGHALRTERFFFARAIPLAPALYPATYLPLSLTLSHSLPLSISAIFAQIFPSLVCFIISVLLALLFGFCCSSELNYECNFVNYFPFK